MTTRLLVALDGSDKDARALRAAGAFAKLVDGSIHLLRILPVPATKVSAGLAIMGGVAEAAPEERATVERAFREIERQLSAESGRTVTWEIADATDVTGELLRRVEHDADIVIMATRGAGTLARAFLGSVADEIVRKSSRPVLVVPPSARYGAGPVHMKRALLPLDGSRLSLSAIDRLLEHVNAGQLEYVLMQAVRAERTGGYVMPTPIPNSPGERALSPEGSSSLHVQAEQTETHLRELAKRLQARADVAAVRVVESGDPASAIVAAVRAELVDLIVMSTHGEGGVRRVLHGSVANRVVRESEVPVFLATPLSMRSASATL